MKSSGFKKYPINFKISSGFTIVELLVVVVIIGILATITIVSYTGVTQRAADVTLKSNLKDASTKLSLYNVTNSTYPADLAAAQAANVFPSNSDTIYQYSLKDGNYCLSAVSASLGGSSYRYSSQSGTIGSGSCNPKVDILVVAGGGGGGSLAGANCGGGGAGGLVYSTDFYLSIGTSYDITIGGGGIQETNGSNSTFDNTTIVAVGGGHGGCTTAPTSGGSGGGARFGSSNNQGNGTLNQGFAGGTGNGSNYGAGGGGGAAEPGNTNIAGSGGDGLGYDISGALIYYAGGGGGGTSGAPSKPAPLGGGGRGAYYPNLVGNGLPNTGGGGGGGADDAGTGIGTKTGGTGGSGVVILRYLIGSMTATGGNTTTSGSYTIHTFTSSGTFAVQ